MASRERRVAVGEFCCVFAAAAGAAALRAALEELVGIWLLSGPLRLLFLGGVARAASLRAEELLRRFFGVLGRRRATLGSEIPKIGFF